MCTVSFLPIGNSKFMITSNRDDAPSRATSTLLEVQIGEKSVKYPQDPIAMGTWIAMSDDRQVAVLLNGAFDKHIRKSKYKESRGTMLLNFFKFDHVNAFITAYDFDNIEPFTLIILEKEDLYELVWDGIKIHPRLLDNTQANIWASTTLYEKDIRDQRKSDFDAWLVNSSTDITKEKMLDFHEHTRKEDLINGFVINRVEKVKTLSITNIIMDKHSIQLSHKDLIGGSVAETSLRIK